MTDACGNLVVELSSTPVRGHKYLDDLDTARKVEPTIVQVIRAGLAFDLKSMIGTTDYCRGTPLCVVQSMHGDNDRIRSGHLDAPRIGSSRNFGPGRHHNCGPLAE